MESPKKAILDNYEMCAGLYDEIFDEEQNARAHYKILVEDFSKLKSSTNIL